MTGYTEFWAGIIGAVIGAITSGAISYFLQRSSTRAEERRATKQEFNERRALAYSLLTKVARIHSNYHLLHNMIEEALSKPLEGELKSHIWLLLKPIANLPTKIEIASTELALLLSMDEIELFKKISMLDELHNGALELLRLHSSLRREIEDLIPAVPVGRYAKINFPTDPDSPIWMKIHNVNQLVQDLRDRYRKDYKDSSDIVELLGKKLKEHFQFNKTIHAVPLSQPTS